MIKASKNIINNKITSITIESQIELFITLGQENFQINDGTKELEYFLINISDTKYELELNENIDDVDLVLLYSLNDINNKPIKGSINLDSKPKEEILPENNIKITNFKFFNDKFSFEILNTVEENYIEFLKNIKIKIKKFKINYFEDFFEEEKEFKKFILIPKTKKFYIDYSFKNNFIYKIEIFNEQTLEEFSLYHIHNKPDVYFSSRYHLNQVLEQLDISFKVQENFDTKLLIWNESLKLMALMEISLNSLPKLTEDIISLFSEYISNKIILNKLINVFSAQFLPGTDYQEGNSVKGKRLGDYQVTQGGESGDSSKIKMVSDKLNNLEDQLREALKFLGFGKAKSYSDYSLNRTKVLKRKTFIKVR